MEPRFFEALFGQGAGNLNMQFFANVRQVPCGIPWILPFIWHTYNIIVEQMLPIGISSTEAECWRRRKILISLEPVFYNIVEELL
jgi:hypothetical protein